MGLDITAYSNTKRLEGIQFDEDGEPINCDEDYMRVYVNPDFPERASGLEDGKCYTTGDASMHFRAGSYSGYNFWREELARMAGYPTAEYECYGTVKHRHDAGAWAAEAGPFFELICFSDCEGVIGAEVSEKLAKDFAEYDERAKSHVPSVHRYEGWFYALYQEWRKAFEMAAQNGMVHFH
ncbi:hypothetical protein [Cupriavidus taiwanensis]|uniref:hypothetical protein n=1 Tax=Cupriavidus taiwanensis TaxID=164546 RepID=UPI000E192F91|nr:hypothetical protein [Cupriavidus taiwanensis]SPA44621.1 conserved hypothetical protein [Cupriavidus taiwanensis]